MKRIEWIKCGAIGAVVGIVVWIISIGARAIERDRVDCAARAGVHVKTHDGFTCVKAEVIDFKGNK